jgi:Family of unknown function (DUF6356)
MIRYTFHHAACHYASELQGITMTNLFDRIFLAHPRHVNEGFGEHFFAASSFGLILIRAGLACLLHACIPSLCLTTASTAVRRLHEELVLHRRKPGHADLAAMLCYEI